MKSVLLESHYLPSIAYFSILSKVDILIVERYEHYVKQSYRNRCYINTAHGKEMLTIPLTGKHGKVLITDVRIDNSQKWLSNQWRTVQSAYGNAPFFEFYAEDLHNLLIKKHEFLYDLNLELLTMCLKWLKNSLIIQESLAYSVNTMNEVSDLRNEINAKNEVGSNKYYKTIPYNQVFGNKFVNNLSIIDLIFCAGPQARQIVQDSAVSE